MHYVYNCMIVLLAVFFHQKSAYVIIPPSITKATNNRLYRNTNNMIYIDFESKMYSPTFFFIF